MDKKKSIESLQFFVTHLAEGAIVHKQQGMIFKAQGITKLGEKYIGHFSEEMGWVEKFTERILDLGGDVKFEGMKSRDLICDPIEYVKADLAIQEPGVELLMKCMEDEVHGGREGRSHHLRPAEGLPEGRGGRPLLEPGCSGTHREDWHAELAAAATVNYLSRLR